MRCPNPFVDRAGRTFGCGQCLPCRINRRRIWSGRIQLEAAQYAENVFLTLTYADEFLPRLPKGGLPTLEPSHLKLFMHRVRTRARRSAVLSNRQVRFFAVGEYGDISFRPHYHVVLFNFPSCVRGGTLSPPAYKRCCGPCDFIADCWYGEDDHGDRAPFGKVDLLPLSPHLAQYIGGYVTKKMVRYDDPRLEGRYPEFARQSLKPGIGAGALHDVADVLLRYYDVEAELGDVPAVLGHGRKELPLGRYLRSQLRKMVGMDAKAPQVTLDKMAEEVLALRLAARADNENPSIKAKVVAENKGRVAGVVARYNIHKQRRRL